MKEEMKKKLQTSQRRMMRMILQTNRKSGKCHAVAQDANAGDAADDEPHEGTTEANPQDPNDSKESNQDTDCNPRHLPSLKSVPHEDEATEDEPEPWSAQPMRHTTCWKQMRSRRGSSDTNSSPTGTQRYQPNTTVSESRKTGQEMGRRHQFVPTANHKSTTRLGSSGHKSA